MSKPRSLEWKLVEVQKQIRKFHSDNGRLPTVHDIDLSDQFPSVRTIQRKWGGLEKVKSDMGYVDVSYSKGKLRGVIASRIGRAGEEFETKIEDLLVNYFGEVFVHVEKKFRSITEDKRPLRVDFFVYNQTNNFAVDTFHTGSYKDLMKNVNIKFKKYSNLAPIPVYFVVMGSNFKQKNITNLLERKTGVIPDNCLVMNEVVFFEEMKKFKSYSNII